MPSTLQSCTCCGGTTFRQTSVLWPELISEWNLDDHEVLAIDRQQGLQCTRCGANLRSMALANAVMSSFRFQGTFYDFARSHARLRVLEINEAGSLTGLLSSMPHHQLVRYPATDMTDLPFDDQTWDLVVHSDTLEHVADPLKGLGECQRVLRPGGFTCFTIPVVGRLTKRRPDGCPSYHGSPGNDEYLVHTEYGADAWLDVLMSGAGECRVTAIDLPSGLAFVMPR
jgi:SAM-dependent methyltransferase